jgi:DNA-binding PadR family transcriptional regulator
MPPIPRYPRSDWALMILSLLNERPMHPYEMRRLIRERGKEEGADLRPGSLYRTIEALARAALVEPVETSRQGRFPERTVYRLTDRGRDELEEWLRELLSTPGRDLPRFFVALSVAGQLEPDDVRGALEARIIRLEGEIGAVDAMARELSGQLPRLFLIENEYARALRQAELDWVRALVEDLRSGRLTWSFAALREAHARMEDATS